MKEGKNSKNKYAKAFPHQIKLYIPNYFIHTFSELQEILRREGSTVSEWFRREAERYVNLHRPGNPQQQIERYISHKRPFFAREKCSLKPCGRTSVAVAEYKGGMKYYVCAVHLQKIRESKDWKIIHEWKEEEKE